VKKGDDDGEKAEEVRERLGRVVGTRVGTRLTRTRRYVTLKIGARPGGLAGVQAARAATPSFRFQEQAAAAELATSRRCWTVGLQEITFAPAV